MNDDDEEYRPSLLKMMALVAVSVAIVILVFFGIGYLFGRAFRVMRVVAISGCR